MKIKKSLRKGNTSIELNHQYGSDSIRAVETEIELIESEAVFRTKLKPVDRNEKADADDLKEGGYKKLKSVSIIDSHVRKGLSDFIDRYSNKIQCLYIELYYLSVFRFKCKLNPIGDDGVRFDVIRE